jgi:hypothetical protein
MVLALLIGLGSGLLLGPLLSLVVRLGLLILVEEYAQVEVETLVVLRSPHFLLQNVVEEGGVVLVEPVIGRVRSLPHRGLFLFGFFELFSISLRVVLLLAMPFLLLCLRLVNELCLRLGSSGSSLGLLRDLFHASLCFLPELKVFSNNILPVGLLVLIVLRVALGTAARLSGALIFLLLLRRSGELVLDLREQSRVLLLFFLSLLRLCGSWGLLGLGRVQDELFAIVRLFDLLNFDRGQGFGEFIQLIYKLVPLRDILFLARNIIRHLKLLLIHVLEQTVFNYSIKVLVDLALSMISAPLTE